MSRPISDLDGRYYFDTEEADRACDFFTEYLTHHQGEFDGSSFALDDWQRDLIIRPIFGWKRTADGLRRFRKMYLEIPKKNGKTKLSAGIALYVLFCDQEPGCEVYCAAADREQAQLVFDDARAMVEDSGELSGMSEIYRRSIVYPARHSTFKVVSADVRSKHGPNIHCLIIDEFHAQPNRLLYDTLSKGVAARRQPLVILITTAGEDMESVCREEHDYAEHVTTGVIEDQAFLPVIFGATLDDDWTSPHIWGKVNPGLGTTVKMDYLEGECRAAMAEPRKQNAFKRLHLNIWTQQHEVWIPVEEWDTCKRMDTRDPKECVAVAAGLDLSSKLDLTACAVLRKFHDDTQPAETIEIETSEADGAPPSKRSLNIDFCVEVTAFFWLPEESLAERVKADHVPYDVWLREGLLRATPGPVVDYNVIYEQIVDEIGPAFGLKHGGEIGYDPYNATQFALQLRDKAGYTVVEVPQTVRHLSEPAKLLQALIRSRRLTHNGHTILRWNVSNVGVKEDKNGNIFPYKTAAKKRIDGVSAMLDALNRLIVMPDRRQGKRKGARVWTRSGFVPVIPSEGADVRA